MNKKKSQKAQEEISTSILQSLISDQAVGVPNQQPGQHVQGQFENFVHMMRNSSNQSGRFKKLLQELKSNDPVRMMQGVIQLSQELSMAQQNTLHHFQCDAFIPQLVECLKQEAMPDTIYFSMISLTQIMDILPNSCNTVVNCGGVKIFVEKIQHIEYIDVAEQAIKGLEKISTENPHSIIAAGGLSTMLNLIQFFDNTVQRRVIKICAKISQNISNQNQFKDHATSALPAITNLIRLQKNPGEFSKFMLQNVASILVRLAQTIIRVTDQAKNFPNILALYSILQNAGIYQPIMRVLVQCLSHLSSLALYSLLKVLSLSCKASFSITNQVVNIGLVQLISQILSFELEKQVQQTLVVSQTLYLLDAVIPDFIAIKDRYAKRSANIKPILPKHMMSPPQQSSSPAATAQNNQNHPQKIKRQKNKLQLLSVNDYALLQYIAQNTMRHLMHLYEDTASGQLRLAAVMAVHKMIVFANRSMLATCPAFKPHKIAHMIFSVFESKNVSYIQLGVEIVNMLFLKAEGLYLSFLEREGVSQTIKKLKVNQQAVFTFFGSTRPKITAPAQEDKKQNMLKQRKASNQDKQVIEKKLNQEEQRMLMQKVLEGFKSQKQQTPNKITLEKKTSKKIRQVQDDMDKQILGGKQENQFESLITKIKNYMHDDDLIQQEGNQELRLFTQNKLQKYSPAQIKMNVQVDNEFIDFIKYSESTRKLPLVKDKKKSQQESQEDDDEQQEQQEQEEYQEEQQDGMNQNSSYGSDLSVEKIFKPDQNPLNQQLGNSYYSPNSGNAGGGAGYYGHGGLGTGFGAYLQNLYQPGKLNDSKPQDISTNYILLKRYDMIYQTAQEICYQFIQNDEWLLKSKSARKQSSTSAFEEFHNLKNVSDDIYKIAQSTKSQNDLKVCLQKLKSLCSSFKQMTNYQFMSSGIIDTLDALLCSTPTLIRAEMNEKIAEEKKRDEVIVESKDEILIKSIQVEQSKDQTAAKSASSYSKKISKQLSN